MVRRWVTVGTEAVGVSAGPSAEERYSFETDGYLVVESLLGSEHVARLREALQRAIARRRELERRGTPHSRGRGRSMRAAPDLLPAGR